MNKWHIFTFYFLREGRQKIICEAQCQVQSQPISKHTEGAIEKCLNKPVMLLKSKNTSTWNKILKK